jgi:hypothetical protein
MDSRLYFIRNAHSPINISLFYGHNRFCSSQVGGGEVCVGKETGGLPSNPVISSPRVTQRYSTVRKQCYNYSRVYPAKLS